MLPEEYPSRQGVSIFPWNVQSFEIHYPDNDHKTNFKSSPMEFSKRASSPETISLGSNTYQGVKTFTDDCELNSPFSESKCSVHDYVPSEQLIQQDDDVDDDYDNDDEVMSSYVIEINSNLRRGDCESSDIDEAIAWAKERFQSRSSEESMRNDGNVQKVQTQGDLIILKNKKSKSLTNFVLETDKSMQPHICIVSYHMMMQEALMQVNTMMMEWEKFNLLR